MVPAWSLPKRRHESADDLSAKAPAASRPRKEGEAEAEGEGDQEAEVDTMGVAVAKLALNTAQRTRDLEGAFQDNLLMTNKNHILIAAQQAGQEYSAAVEGKKPEDHKKGPPHIHKWNAILQKITLDLKAATEAADEDKQLEQPVRTAAETFEKYAAAWTELDIDTATIAIGMCKIRTCRNKKGREKSSRLIFVLRDLPERSH